MLRIFNENSCQDFGLNLVYNSWIKFSPRSWSNYSQDLAKNSWFKEYLFIAKNLSCQDSCQDLVNNFLGKILARILARSCQDNSLARSCQDLAKILSESRAFSLAKILARSCQDKILPKSWQESWQELAKILPRSCQKLKLEQSWQDLMRSCQDLGKILLRSEFFFVRDTQLALPYRKHATAQLMRRIQGLCGVPTAVKQRSHVTRDNLELRGSRPKW